LRPEKKYWLPRMVKTSGALSPATLAIASNIPVTTPLLAVVSTTLKVVLHLLIPRAMEASRIEFGTSFSDSSVERVTTGSIMMDSAKAPATTEKLLRVRTMRVKITTPITTEGNSARTSFKNLIIRPTGLSPNSDR
jgi:hypothetical protein